MTKDLEEPWFDNVVPYQLCDHICEPYRFKNGIAKWPTCSLDVDGFCNGSKLPEFKTKVEESWGNATHGVMKFCTWLINSFEDFHELDYNVLLKLQECWWNINADEAAPFTRSQSYGHGPYANIKNN
nr:hypothetical protein [Tanacetum cinerariifolium]